MSVPAHTAMPLIAASAQIAQINKASDGKPQAAHPKCPTLQGGSSCVCYTLITAQEGARSFCSTRGRFTLKDSTCNGNSLSHPGSAGGCRGDGASSGQGQAFTSSLGGSSVEQGLQTTRVKVSSGELQGETQGVQWKESMRWNYQ